MFAFDPVVIALYLAPRASAGCARSKRVLHAVVSRMSDAEQARLARLWCRA